GHDHGGKLGPAARAGLAGIAPQASYRAGRGAYYLRTVPQRTTLLGRNERDAGGQGDRTGGPVRTLLGGRGEERRGRGRQDGAQHHGRRSEKLDRRSEGRLDPDLQGRRARGLRGGKLTGERR